MSSRMNVQTVAGIALTYFVVVVLLLDAVMQFVLPPPLRQAMEQTGFDPSTGPQLAVVMLVCAITLAIPSTSALGAILTTAFLGGAIAVHVRIGEIVTGSQIFCVLLGAAAWGGVYLRNERVRQVLPIRRSAAAVRA